MLRTSLIAISLAALLAMACGGQSAGSPPSGAPSGGQNVAPTAAPQATATQPAPTAGFGEMMRGAKNISYKATYKVTGTSGGQSFTMEQTTYQKPPKMRTDMTLPQGATSMFILEEGVFMCTAAGGDKTCIKMGSAQGAQGDQTAAAQNEMTTKPENFDATPAGTRQIAGQTGNCFTVKPKQMGSFDQATYCVTSSGIALFTQVKGTNFDMTMEATSVSTTVSDADLQLPAPVMDMPSVPGFPGGVPNIPGGARP